MQKSILFSAITTLAFLFISCSGATKQYISPDMNGDYSNESVSLLVIERGDFPDIAPDHRFGELRINEQPVFSDRLKNLFRDATGANVKSEMRAIDLDQSSFTVRQFTEGGTNLKFVAPSDGTELKSESESPRFVFMLDGFRFETYEELVGGDSYAGHEPDVVPRITFETNYLIWDNAAREAIAWGTIDSDRVINLSRINEIYDQLILDSFQRMTRNSPFTPQRG
ncbi:hypothetical protein BH23BAC3_BH23BAC3_14670 [soil metagenome]